jgi:hypothetical protein
METSLTLFKSIYDNKTSKRMDFENFSRFEVLLYRLAEVEREDKRSAQLISPATYLPNTTRKNANVVNWAGWAAIDVDDHEFKGNLKNELHDKFGNHYYVCYSTASSTNEYPKFRLVFPLTREVEASRIKHFWFALNTEFESIGDKQTKDLSRMYYIPATYADANNFIFTNTGDWIDPDALMEKHKYLSNKKTGNSFFDRLPEEMQKKIIEHRKSQMENRSIQWTSYRDCPFISRKMLAEYSSITETGWYHKMYQMMVAIAASAIRREYPITAKEIADLCRELDAETGNWYQNRPLETEAERAIEYVYSTNL